MDYNTILNLSYCGDIVNGVRSLLFYANGLPALVAIILGFFIFFQVKKTELSWSLFLLNLLFAIWCIFNLSIWLFYAKNGLVMFLWAPTELISISIFLLSIYFVNVFINQKSPSVLKLFFIFVIFAFFAFLSPTNFNLVEYDATQCVAIENLTHVNIVYYSKLVLSIWVILEMVYGYILKKDRRKEILILGFGILFFLLSFFFAGRISDVTGDYKFELYGLFGMIVFMSIMTYLIVKFKTFNIKLIGAQALIWALVLLIGSEFFFIRNNINRVLTAITLVITIGIGIVLVRNVKKEVQQREMIEKLAKTLEKTNKDLEVSNEQLKKLDQMKSEFVSLATHQIRSPLTAIKGYASMILEGDYGDVKGNLKDAINTIFQSCENLVKIVGDFLDISRIEQGRMKYEYSVFNVRDVAKEVLNELKPNINKKGLEEHFEAEAGDTWNIKADIGKIKQVIGNIIDNSIKYTPKGSITIKVKKVAKNAVLEVSDTGVGIDALEIPKLFSKFTRAKDANKTNTTGTGLGLYVAKQMIEAQGGKISVESPGVGKGSVFKIEFPLNAEQTQK